MFGRRREVDTSSGVSFWLIPGIGQLGAAASNSFNGVYVARGDGVEEPRRRGSGSDVVLS